MLLVIGAVYLDVWVLSKPPRLFGSLEVGSVYLKGMLLVPLIDFVIDEVYWYLRFVLLRIRLTIEEFA